MTPIKDTGKLLSALSLRVKKGASPFALITIKDCQQKSTGEPSDFALMDRDDNLSPEEWAWQFLRLNGTYKKKYAEALERHKNGKQPSPTFYPNKHAEQKVLVNEEICRNHFGLSTWLDPAITRLPKLKRGQSWFSPLNKVYDFPVSEISADIVESIWGYTVTTGTAAAQMNRHRLKCSTHVWFPVDCTVRPELQLQSIEVLAKGYRNWCKRLNPPLDNSETTDVSFLELSKCKWIEEKNLREPCFASKETKNMDDLWRAIRIDVNGPIKAQIMLHRVDLIRAYESLLRDNRSIPPYKLRLHSERKIKDGSDTPTKGDSKMSDQYQNFFTDGNLFKAMVVAAQLSQQGANSSTIADLLIRYCGDEGTLSGKGTGTLADESGDFAVRIADYTERARVLVKLGYRWLVHAQQPKT